MRMQFWHYNPESHPPGPDLDRLVATFLCEYSQVEVIDGLLYHGENTTNDWPTRTPAFSTDADAAKQVIAVMEHAWGFEYLGHTVTATGISAAFRDKGRFGRTWAWREADTLYHAICLAALAALHVSGKHLVQWPDPAHVRAIHRPA